MTMMRAAVVCIVCLLSMEVSAFHASGPLLPTRRMHWISQGSVDSDAKVEGSTQEATLTFNCDSVYTSDPVPAATPQEVFEFFQKPAQRNCMISAGNQRVVEEVETSKFLGPWKERCRQLGAAEPDASDSVLKIITSAMKFPGLTLTSVAYIGSKLLEPQGQGNDYPVYEFSLIQDEQIVEGLKPAVWMFNQITGANSDKSKDKSQSSLSLSRVTAVPTEGGQTVFNFLIKFEIKISFPKLLLRILPVSKEKAEEQGSTTIGKTLTKDLNNSMKVLRQQYLEQ